ncbi:MAG: histidine kinase [Sulfurimonas sp. RIFOXYD12_FULL_33_39]|uniref:ATP-binding protein n=1 Tax=unclassified Sulfurimonas TaxID=2623549 RepID=UPI0008BB19B2|nr:MULTISPECIES: ATP-binding protein [unclassified Sulfurimonas]OHE06651.1 MAG: histidine kinase [Sulfurimonas sp. RIFCSPLOWO2_12_FULL_34_6]OHE10504.1 MAG: histidine kinase [Sulfurimonas sp. RIFOXYD12_FULL_33_39]OHE14963.1 MAG: histidine kinase [Sulfurimonas sp. RIFOXYD2_FULL_34_21]DAB28253.1 MAG TPA: hybrid sensor histidine kinase/response regulator [Sulfurimonas sp. UBA10385]
MQFGLKNRLRLISLLPIIVLFTVTSYYVYNSFMAYQAAQLLQNRLNQNANLNEIVGNIARERGMSAMYMGNKTQNILTSIKEQRKIVDEKIATYILEAKESKIPNRESNIEVISDSLAKIRSIRPLLDENKIEFNKMFIGIYTNVQKRLIKQLEHISDNQIDKEINELYSLYISMVNAKEASGIERGYLSYIISRSAQLTNNDLNTWISLIGKADALYYEGIQNKNLIGNLDILFKTQESRELFKDINSERTAIITAATNGEYNITSGVWFTMLSEKINTISKAENLLLDAMNSRAKEVQNNSLKIFIITFLVWLIAIILALLGYLLSNEIAYNIKHLENVLKKVAEDYDSQKRKIDLNTSEGTNMAYELLEEIIEQTKRDKISAQEASEAKSMFLANMSHEIRTPLNGIVGFTELLKDSGLEEEQIEFVDIIEKSSENLLEIINNILDLSKIESNKLEIEQIAFNPVLEFESAVEVYAVRASEKHIDLGCFIDPSLESLLIGDPTKLKEIIINLLSNAVKFTNNYGSINVNIRKTVSNETGKIKIKFEIQDSGIGITNEQKSKIFEAFNQADASITRKYGGTGLGLTISSRFVELMGGKLSLLSKIGEGSTFFFTLEFDEVELIPKNSQENFSNLNVLILNDSVRSKKQDKYLTEYLDYFGIGYKTFIDVAEIETFEKTTSYNLILVDYDYITSEALVELAKLSQELVVLTKSNLMKKIDALNLNIFKILYEPIHYSKLRQTFENYNMLNISQNTPKKQPKKSVDLDKLKFSANVLIAEDNVINQKLIKRTLEDLGLCVTIANNGLEAFQKRKDGNFDVIFMDIQMPFLDGVEATNEILEWERDYNKPHIPIIALTANALNGDRERFLSSGLDEYTTKPLVRSQIVSLLNKFLNEHIIEDIKIEQNKNEEQESVPKYKADILIAKKSAFETKLYGIIIESINGLTYEVASSLENFQELIEKNSYKIVLFDKEYSNMDIAEISATIRKLSTLNKLKSHIILIDDSLEKNALEHIEHVDEIIGNEVNRDLLLSLFIKYS